MGRWVSCALVGLMAFLLVDMAVGFAWVDRDFVVEEVASELEVCVDFVFVPGTDGSQILVLEKTGQVFLVVDGVREQKRFLDLREQVNSVLDRGALGLAVDVDFENGMRYIYINYAVEVDPADLYGPKSGRVSRFQVSDDGTEALVDSEVVILGTVDRDGCDNLDGSEDIICLDAAQHALGGIEMDSSGHLWISCGDAAKVNNPVSMGIRPQMTQNFNGKIFRVNRDGRGLEENPFWNGDETSNESKIYGLGARQPFRIHPDPDNPECLWVSEVGWTSFEEINYVCRGWNGMWPCQEAALQHLQFSEFGECQDIWDAVASGDEVARFQGIPQEPVYAYGRDEGSSSTGAIRMKVEDWPAKYRNAVFFMDYTGGWMRYFHVDADGKKVDGPFDFATNLKGPVQVREGVDGCMWVLSLDAGKLLRICYQEDTSNPQVDSISPPDGSSNNEISSPIVVTLSKPVTPESVATALSVQLSLDGQAVEGKVEYREQGLRIEFRPDEYLMTDTSYDVTVFGLVDYSGREQDAGFTSSFTTGGGYTVYVSDIDPLVSVNGHERKPIWRDVQKQGGVLKAISHRGIDHEKGLVAVPFARYCVTVPAGCSRLQGEVAVDDISFNLDGGALIFEIKSMAADSGSSLEVVDGEPGPDGIVLWNSYDVKGEVLRRRDDALSHRVDVEPESATCFDLINGGWDRLHQQVGSWGSTRYRCGQYDEVQPSVMEMIPAPGSVTGLDPMVELTFSETMQSSTVVEAISLYQAGTMDLVAWIPEFSKNQASIKLTRDGQSKLEYSTEYCVKVEKRAKDLAGNRMSASFTGCFTTEKEPNSGFPVDVVATLQDSMRAEPSKRALAIKSFPRKIRRGLKTYEKGIGMRSVSVLVFDLANVLGPLDALGGCTLDGIAGVDASIPFWGIGKCRMKITGGEESNALFARRFLPGKPGIPFSVPLPDDGIIRLRVSASSDGRENDYCNFAEARVSCDADGNEVYLSDLEPIERSGSVAMDRKAKSDGDREPLTLFTRVTKYDSGLILGHVSWARFKIPKSACSTLSLEAGIDRRNVGGHMKIIVDAQGHAPCKLLGIRSGKGPRKLACDVTDADWFEISALHAEDADEENLGTEVLIGNIMLDCAPSVQAPQVTIGGLPETFAVGDMLEYTVEATSITGAELPDTAITCSVTLVHCMPECHNHPDQNNVGRQGSYKIPDHGDYFYVLVGCDVEDGDQKSSASMIIMPRTVPVTVHTIPPGLTVKIDSVTGPSPLQTTVVAGATFPITAIADADTDLQFEQWIESGIGQKEFEVENVIEEEQVFTASYA